MENEKNESGDDGKIPKEVFINKIIQSAYSNEKCILIKDFKNSSQENEFLFFLKPECFHFKNKGQLFLLLDLIFRKIEQFNINIEGILTLKGDFLRESKIIEKHYGVINKLSVNASKIISNSDKEKIKELLKIKDLKEYKILGGHELLNKYSSISEDNLNKLWYGGNAVRIGEGFYAQIHKINGDNIILINGFHPSQIKHYTKTENKIVLFLLNTDTDWSVIRNDFVGDTFPENAKRGSIREVLFRNKDKYHVKKINVAQNFIHASSGPFDALFEICNFVGNIKNINYCKYNTNIYYLMKNKYGLSDEDYEICLCNPSIQIEEITYDLFSLTKNKNTNEAIQIYIRYFK